MRFLQFIRTQTTRQDPVGDVARAIEIEIVDEGMSEMAVEYMLFDEAQAVGVACGIKALHALWNESKPKSSP